MKKNIPSKIKIAINTILSQEDQTQESIMFLMNLMIHTYEHDRDNLAYTFQLTHYIKKMIKKMPPTPELTEIYWKCVLHEAPHIFESFMLYMEKDRPYGRRFYQPRQDTLSVIVNDLQKLDNREYEFLGLSLPPRVGKSTTCIFFMAWHIGRYPNSHNAMCGHSNILAVGFYRETLNLITSMEYNFSEIFPDCSLEMKNGERLELNFNMPDRFPTLTCRGIDGTWTGAVDISSDGYLYVDDLIKDRTESLNPRRMEARYNDYLNLLVSRKIDGARELQVATRWSLLDPLGRVEEAQKNNPNYYFRKIPALNEKDESNFNYKINGFSSQYYINIRNMLDINEWQALYQQAPFVREGLVFTTDSIKLYNGVLPEKGLTRIVAHCDVAWGGGDNLSMPFAFLYDDGKVYIHDWIHSSDDKYMTKPLVVKKIMEHEPHQIQFEANAGGEEYADDVGRLLREKGFKTSITSKYSANVSKVGKIIQYAPDVKQNFYFLEPEARSYQYEKAMCELFIFVQVGKNEHDDSPDAITSLAEFINTGVYAKVEAFKRPF